MTKSKVFRSVPEICDGCGMCELMCSLKHTGKVNPHLARIKVLQSDSAPSRYPNICRHCNNAPCAEACPVPGAMFLDEATGAVVINDEKCIKCLACVDACAFGAIQVGPDKEILKCDLCGGNPVCVKYCPPRPGNFFPHLPLPTQSCLQYSEPSKTARETRLATGETGYQDE